MSKRILVAVGWPYASGELHLGQFGGAYLPPDIFARYHRIIGNDVLMVSGSDAHGTPITVKADQEGTSPRQVVEKYHELLMEVWARAGISFDLFTSTMTDNHARVTQDVFLKLLEGGYLYKQVSQQYFDPEAKRFLPDRYVEGTCPHCGFGDARGDQCDNCGRTLDVTDLIAPRSKLSGATPVVRDTEHYFFKLSAFAKPVREWLETKTDWRKQVRNWALGMIEEGLPDRAITRDIDWGVEVPVTDLGPGKRIYVWFDAVIGYLSASIEWASRTEKQDSWKLWWEEPDAESYYFIGKDNIPFHTVMWPAMLMGYGGLNLPTDVPANQYITFGGAKASKSKGVGSSVLWYLDRLEPDALRYAIASVLPEQNDTDISDEMIMSRVNEELVATWGNLVNRVLTMSSRNFDGHVPAPRELHVVDQHLLDAIDEMLVVAAGHIERAELRAALRAAMDAAGEVNAYLNDQEPWKVVTDNPAQAGTTLWTALQAISGIRVALTPYLPATSAALGGMLGLGPAVDEWKRPEVEGGKQLGEIRPLFAKLDDGVFDS